MPKNLSNLIYFVYFLVVLNSIACNTKPIQALRFKVKEKEELKIKPSSTKALKLLDMGVSKITELGKDSILVTTSNGRQYILKLGKGKSLELYDNKKRIGAALKKLQNKKNDPDASSTDNQKHTDAFYKKSPKKMAFALGGKKAKNHKSLIIPRTIATFEIKKGTCYVGFIEPPKLKEAFLGGEKPGNLAGKQDKFKELFSFSDQEMEAITPPPGDSSASAGAGDEGESESGGGDLNSYDFTSIATNKQEVSKSFTSCIPFKIGNKLVVVVKNKQKIKVFSFSTEESQSDSEPEDIDEEPSKKKKGKKGPGGGAPQFSLANIPEDKIPPPYTKQQLLALPDNLKQKIKAIVIQKGGPDKVKKEDFAQVFASIPTS